MLPMNVSDKSLILTGKGLEAYGLCPGLRSGCVGLGSSSTVGGMPTCGSCVELLKSLCTEGMLVAGSGVSWTAASIGLTTGTTSCNG